jgi:hypothetical protein
MSYLMICQVCYNDFDGENHKPYLITPCGHSFCLQCLFKLSTPKICPIDRQIIKSSAINRHVVDSLPLPPTTANLNSMSALDLLKKSLVDEINEYGNEIFTINKETIKNAATAIRDKILKDRDEKIKILELDAKKTVESLDKITKNLVFHSRKVNYNSVLIKHSGEQLLKNVLSSKDAIEISDEIKKKITEIAATLKTFNFKFESTVSKSARRFNKNSIGKLVEENCNNITTENDVKIITNNFDEKERKVSFAYTKYTLFMMFVLIVVFLLFRF